MAEDIVVRYRAEVDEALKKIQAFADANTDVQKSTDKAGKSIDKTTKSVDNLGKETQATSNQIKDSTKSVDDFAKKGEGAFNGLAKSAKSFALGAGAALAAAFSVDAIIQFGKASITAFLDAEKNAERLRFAITSIGGESEAAFDRLIKQSEELQKITVFDDDSIQQAQAALSAFGLTANEIERTIPLLADFATVTGVDIAQAAQQLGAGLEGAGREFKKYGIEVSATATRQQNLNAILGGFSAFAGSAEAATKTLTGRLEQQRNIVADLQEQLGARLAPVFVRIKEVALEAALGLLGFNRAADQLEGNTQTALERTYTGLAERIKKEGGDVEQEFNKFLTNIDSRIDAIGKKNQEISQQIAERLEIVSRSNREILPQNDQLIQQLNKQIEENNRLVGIEKQSAEAIKAVIQATTGKRSAEEAASTEAIKNTDERIAGSDKEVQTIERLTAQYKDLLDLLKATPQQKELLALGLASNDIEEFKQKVAEVSAENKVEVPVELVIPEDRVVKEEGEKLGGSLADSFLKRFQEEIAVTGALLSELSQLYSAFTNSKLQEIERERDAQLAAIDEQLKANDEALSKQRISEQEAANNEKRLLAERLKAEETAAKKERDLKRKAAIADKAAALVQIAISTAVNIVKAGNPALSALYAALGAAQAAVVAAQPIPYAKGTKKAKKGLARVGEEGEEIMYVPGGTKVLPNKQTNRYGEVLDAMFDNKFDQLYIKRKDIAPQLIRQKQIREVNTQKSFAENIAQSAMVNPATGLTYFDMEALRKKGQNLTDDTIERLAIAITKRSGYDPYRR